MGIKARLGRPRAAENLLSAWIDENLSAKDGVNCQSMIRLRNERPTSLLQLATFALVKAVRMLQRETTRKLLVYTSPCCEDTRTDSDSAQYS